MKVTINMSNVETIAMTKIIPEIGTMINRDQDDVNKTMRAIDDTLRNGNETQFSSYASGKIEKVAGGNVFTLEMKEEFIADSFKLFIKILKITQPIWSMLLSMKGLLKQMTENIKEAYKEFGKKWSDECAYFYRVYKFNGDDSDKWNVVSLIRKNKVTNVEEECHRRTRAAIGNTKTMNTMFDIWQESKTNNGMFTTVYESSSFDEKKAAYEDLDEREANSNF